MIAYTADTTRQSGDTCDESRRERARVLKSLLLGNTEAEVVVTKYS